MHVGMCITKHLPVFLSCFGNRIHGIREESPKCVNILVVFTKVSSGARLFVSTDWWAFVLDVCSLVDGH